MKDTKRRFEWCSFYDHTGIEAHLERMAAQGWLLEKIGSFAWHYRRTEPKELTFSVSYFPRASGFDPEPSQEQETFYDFCAHTGWTLAAASAQMQIFYNERPDPVPIDTDPAMEVDAIHRSAKKSFLISQILLLAVGALNFGQCLWRLLDAPVETLSSTLMLFSLMCWPVLFLMIGTELVTYFRWRRRALKAAEQGEFLATRSHPAVQKASLAVVLAGLAWCLSYLRGGILTMMVVWLICMFAIIFAVIQLRELLRRKKVPAGINRAVTFGACAALPVAMVVLILAFTLRTGGFGPEEPGELPLTLPDLLEQPDGENDVRYRHFSQSPLVVLLSTNQELRWGSEAGGPARAWINYGVTLVKAPVLYDWCRDSLLHQYDHYDKHYSPVDAAPWGAQAAYQSAYEGCEPMDEYLLCYPDRIVVIDLGWEPTPAQMAVVAEKLGRGDF